MEVVEVVGAQLRFLQHLEPLGLYFFKLAVEVVEVVAPMLVVVVYLVQVAEEEVMAVEVVEELETEMVQVTEGAELLF